MEEHPNFSELLQFYLTRRFGNDGTAGDVARAVNSKFNLGDAEGLKRQSVNNWLKGPAIPRDWWPIAAMSCVLCETEAEADELLHVAGHMSIAAKRAEREQIRPMDEVTRQRVEEQAISYWDEITGKPAETPQVAASSPLPAPKNAFLTFLTSTTGKVAVGGIGLTTLVLILALAWSNRAEEHATVISDDFSDQARCEILWTFGEAPHGQCNAVDGRLTFTLPMNASEEWYGEIADSTQTGNFLVERIRFTAALDPNQNKNSLGTIGIQTDCHDEGTYLAVYLGGPEQKLFAEYGKNDVAEAGLVSFAPIELGREHTVELTWQPGGIQVRLDGKAQAQTIPCSQTKWLNLTAGTDPGTAVSGYITDIRVWERQ